jgi:DNA replication protein DnaC
VDLTPEEEQAALYQARKSKYIRIEQEKYNREYWEKVTRTPVIPNLTAKELRNKLLLARTASGKRFVIEDDNMSQVNTLCLYFANDPKIEDYGYSLNKGLMLMGGLGVAKTFLMSFFANNQKASYVMMPCRQIENKWLNAKKEDPDVIDHYSNVIQASVNHNAFGHQQLGLCMDDLGTEPVPSKRFGEEKNVMAEILLGRYERHGIDFSMTHITTNLTGEQIIDLYGDRINSRLIEMCNVVTFDGVKNRRS